MVKQFLHDWHVVIMRPSHQAQSLIDGIKAHGATPLLLPLMEIQPLTFTKTQHSNVITTAKQCSYVIVTSANAVLFAPDAILNILREREVHIVTMGKATTQALNNKGLQVYFTAPAGSTSESLLQHPFLSEENIFKQNVLLLAGEGGRTVLAETLQARGAKVTWLKTYQQQKVNIDIAKMLRSWQAHKQHCFVATSSRVLDSLRELTPLEYILWLQKCPLIVVSDRIASHAREWGFQHIFVAKAPHTDEILEALQQMTQLCTMI